MWVRVLAGRKKGWLIEVSEAKGLEGIKAKVYQRHETHERAVDEEREKASVR